MGLSDATAPPVQGLWLLLGGCSCLATRPWCRASQVPNGSVCARCLLSPRRVQPVRLVEASGLMLASPLLEGWPLSITFNEAESSSRDTTARAFAASGFDRQDCSRQPQIWLHDFRPLIMMNTFQFTRTTELSWRTRRKQRKRSLVFVSSVLSCSSHSGGRSLFAPADRRLPAVTLSGRWDSADLAVALRKLAVRHGFEP
jgi:hypothetical protein